MGCVLARKQAGARKRRPTDPWHKGAVCLPDIWYSGCRWRMRGCTNGRVHGGLGGKFTILRTRRRPFFSAPGREWRCPNTKKAGRFPMRDDVGPAKNPIPWRQRNAQQGTRIQCSCWYFEHGIKRIYWKLGWFTSSFDEIRLKMSLERTSTGAEVRFKW